METLFAEPIFGFSVTIIAFYLATQLNNIIRHPLTNPLLIAVAMIIFLLSIFDIEYASYAQGGQIIAFFLGPATVALAVPLYKNRRHLMGHAVPVILTVISGSMVAMFVSGGLAKVFGATPVVVNSLLPKSVTTPIAVEISQIIGGIPELTGVFVGTTGLVGGIWGPEILKWAGVTSPMAQGMAIGVATHGIGTARALQEGELTGSSSALAMGLAGLLTALTAPFIAGFF